MSVSESSRDYQNLSDVVTTRTREKCYGILARREALKVDHSEFIQQRVDGLNMQLSLPGYDIGTVSDESWKKFRRRILSFRRTKDTEYLCSVFKETLNIPTVQLNEMVDKPESFSNTDIRTVYTTQNPLTKLPRVVAMQKAVKEGLAEATRNEVNEIVSQAHPSSCCVIA